MPNSIQFMDCPECGKRVRTEAARCHHCHTHLPHASSERALIRAQPRADDAEDYARTQRDDDHDADEDISQSHYAINGGYDSQNDDFDYEAYIAEEFPETNSPTKTGAKPWVWVTAWILIVAMLLPFFYYFLIRA